MERKSSGRRLRWPETNGDGELAGVGLRREGLGEANGSRTRGGQRRQARGGRRRGDAAETATGPAVGELAAGWGVVRVCVGGRWARRSSEEKERKMGGVLDAYIYFFFYIYNCDRF